MSDFREIYEKHSKSVYRFLLSLTRNEAMAEELLQETFYRALLSIDRFEGKSSVYTWLCQIGKNAWLKECQKSSLYCTLSLENMTDVMSSDPSPEDQIVRRDEYIRVRRAISCLDEPYRNVFILHAYAGVKLKEIADMYERSESWARVTYYRAKQKIISEVSK